MLKKRGVVGAAKNVSLSPLAFVNAFSNRVFDFFSILLEIKRLRNCSVRWEISDDCVFSKVGLPCSHRFPKTTTRLTKLIFFSKKK